MALNRFNFELSWQEMVHVPVFYGEWMLRDSKCHFEMDHVKGGRMFSLDDACTYRELIDMARDDYQLVESAEFIDLTYMLPEEMLEALNKDCPTPPIKVTNDRHVRSFMELRKTHGVRLCVSSRLGHVSENDVEIGNEEFDFDDKATDDVSFEDDLEYDEDDLEDDDMHLSDSDEDLGEVKDDNFDQESVVKEEYLDQEFEQLVLTAMREKPDQDYKNTRVQR